MIWLKRFLLDVRVVAGAIALFPRVQRADLARVRCFLEKMDFL